MAPDGPSAEETLHSVTITSAVTDIYGTALGGVYTFSFTTEDTTPPPRPEAGQVTLTIPDEETGVTSITGTQGTVAPDTIVIAVNNSTGETVTVIAEPDGSFAMDVEAVLAAA